MLDETTGIPVLYLHKSGKGDGRMRTGSEMLAYCNEKRFAGVKEKAALGFFDDIARKLKADEKVAIAIWAWFSGIGDDCAYAVTDERILWKGKKAEGAIAFEDMINYEFEASRMYGSELGIITLNSYGATMTLGNTRSAAAEFFQLFKQHVEYVNSPSYLLDAAMGASPVAAPDTRAATPSRAPSAASRPTQAAPPSPRTPNAAPASFAQMSLRQKKEAISQLREKIAADKAEANALARRIQESVGVLNGHIRTYNEELRASKQP